MPDYYKKVIPIIRRDLSEGFLRGVPARPLATGAVLRDFSVDPVEMRDSPDRMKVYDPSEWDALYDRGEELEDSLEHVYLRAAEAGEFEFLDQNGFPDCWAHSTLHAVMIDRLKQNLPYVKLNGVALATLMDRTNGGWCGLSMKFVRENGCPVAGTGPGEWRYQSRKGQDTPELRASMARYKAAEDWYDLGRPEYDQRETKDQLATALFDNCPTPADFNRAGHSMCELRLVRIERGHWGLLDLNSWKGFGYHGLCVLSLDDGWWPDNAASLRSSTPSA